MIFLKCGTTETNKAIYENSLRVDCQFIVFLAFIFFVGKSEKCHFPNRALSDG